MSDFEIRIDHDYSNDRELVLVLTSPDATVTYQDAADAVAMMLDAWDMAEEGWTVDDDIYRVGVGVAAGRGATGVSSKFIAGITKTQSPTEKGTT